MLRLNRKRVETLRERKHTVGGKAMVLARTDGSTSRVTK